MKKLITTAILVVLCQFAQAQTPSPTPDAATQQTIDSARDREEKARDAEIQQLRVNNEALRKEIEREKTSAPSVASNSASPTATPAAGPMRDAGTKPGADQAPSTTSQRQTLGQVHGPPTTSKLSDEDEANGEGFRDEKFPKFRVITAGPADNSHLIQLKGPYTIQRTKVRLAGIGPVIVGLIVDSNSKMEDGKPPAYIDEHEPPRLVPALKRFEKHLKPGAVKWGGDFVKGYWYVPLEVLVAADRSRG